MTDDDFSRKEKLCIKWDICPEERDEYIFCDGYLKHKSLPSFGRDVSIGKGSIIKNDVHIGESVDIGSNVYVGESVHIGSNIDIGDDVYIEKNTVISNLSQICDGTRIFENVTIEDDVFVEKWCKIGKDVTIGESSYIERDSEIGNNVLIGRNVWIKSKTLIADNSIIKRTPIIIYDNGHIGEAGDGKISIYGDIWNIDQIYNLAILWDMSVGSNMPAPIQYIYDFAKYIGEFQKKYPISKSIDEEVK